MGRLGCVLMGALLLAGLARAARADSLSLDFTNTDTVIANSFSETEGGPTWTAIAQIYVDPGMWGAGGVHQDANGFGVDRTSAPEPQIKGVNTVDLLSTCDQRLGLSFSPSVMIDTLTFHNVVLASHGEQFRLHLDDGSYIDTVVVGDGTSNVAVFDLTAPAPALG